MQIPARFDKPQPLGAIIDHLDEMSWTSWLYIRDITRDIDLTIECFPIDMEAGQPSQEESDQLLTSLTAAGFKEFFCREQLAGILDNLRLQRRNYSRMDIEKAIDHYWKHDAYIEL